MPKFRRTDTVTVHRRATAGRAPLGNETFTFTDVDYPGTVVWTEFASPTRSNRGGEQTNDGDLLPERLGMLMPQGAQIDAYDEVTVRGKRYEVTGEPLEQISPITGRDVGVSVNLHRATG
jgi:hypothetical protein